MLGSMAWDSVGKRVILFGGGYISAYKSGGSNTKILAPNGKPWMPADWTLSEKRATWAFDPETLRWKKIATGSASFNQFYESAGVLSRKSRLWLVRRAVSLWNTATGFPASRLRQSPRMSSLY